MKLSKSRESTSVFSVKPEPEDPTNLSPGDVNTSYGPCDQGQMALPREHHDNLGSMCNISPNENSDLMCVNNSQLTKSSACTGQHVEHNVNVNSNLCSVNFQGQSNILHESIQNVIKSVTRGGQESSDQYGNLDLNSVFNQRRTMCENNLNLTEVNPNLVEHSNQDQPSLSDKVTAGAFARTMDQARHHQVSDKVVNTQHLNNSSMKQVDETRQLTNNNRNSKHAETISCTKCGKQFFDCDKFAKHILQMSCDEDDSTDVISSHFQVHISEVESEEHSDDRSISTGTKQSQSVDHRWNRVASHVKQLLKHNLMHGHVEQQLPDQQVTNFSGNPTHPGQSIPSLDSQEVAIRDHAKQNQSVDVEKLKSRTRTLIDLNQDMPSQIQQNQSVQQVTNLSTNQIHPSQNVLHVLQDSQQTSQNQSVDPVNIMHRVVPPPNQGLQSQIGQHQSVQQVTPLSRKRTHLDQGVDSNLLPFDGRQNQIFEPANILHRILTDPNKGMQSKIGQSQSVQQVTPLSRKRTHLDQDIPLLDSHLVPVDGRQNQIFEPAVHRTLTDPHQGMESKIGQSQCVSQVTDWSRNQRYSSHGIESLDVQQFPIHGQSRKNQNQSAEPESIVSRTLQVPNQVMQSQHGQKQWVKSVTNLFQSQLHSNQGMSSQQADVHDQHQPVDSVRIVPRTPIDFGQDTAPIAPTMQVNITSQNNVPVYVKEEKCGYDISHEFPQISHEQRTNLTHLNDECVGLVDSNTSSQMVGLPSQSSMSFCPGNQECPSSDDKDNLPPLVKEEEEEDLPESELQMPEKAVTVKEESSSSFQIRFKRPGVSDNVGVLPPQNDPTGDEAMQSNCGEDVVTGVGSSGQQITQKDSKDSRMACVRCSQIFLNTTAYAKHIMSCGISPVHHICSVCGTQYTNKEDLIQHHESMHTKFLFNCPHCRLIFSTSHECKRHQQLCVPKSGQRSPTKRGTYQKLVCSVVLSKLPYCAKCHQAFVFKFSYIRHQKRHEEELYKDLPYLCSGCRKGFSNQDNCLRHGRVCKYLNPKSSSDGLDAEEMEYRSGNGNDPSQASNNSYEDDEELVAESGCQGNSGLTGEKLPAEVKSLQIVCDKLEYCTDCHLVFSTKADFVSHLGSHKVEEYRCKYCRRRFKNSATLLWHWHQQQSCKKSCTCSGCNQEFSNVISRLKHELKHKSLPNSMRRIFERKLETNCRPMFKPFSCCKCGKCFGKYETRSHHKQLHHIEKHRRKTKVKLEPNRTKPGNQCHSRVNAWKKRDHQRIVRCPECSKKFFCYKICTAHQKRCQFVERLEKNTRSHQPASQGLQQSADFGNKSLSQEFSTAANSGNCGNSSVVGKLAAGNSAESSGILGVHEDNERRMPSGRQQRTGTDDVGNDSDDSDDNWEPEALEHDIYVDEDDEDDSSDEDWEAEVESDLEGEQRHRRKCRQKPNNTSASRHQVNSKVNSIKEALRNMLEERRKAKDVSTHYHACDTCGASFDTAKGLHVHQAQIYALPSPAADKGEFYSANSLQTHKKLTVVIEKENNGGQPEAGNSKESVEGDSSKSETPKAAVNKSCGSGEMTIADRVEERRPQIATSGKVESDTLTRVAASSINETTNAAVNSSGDAVELAIMEGGRNIVIPAVAEENDGKVSFVISYNHVCDICDAGFYSANSLQKHKETHMLSSICNQPSAVEEGRPQRDVQIASSGKDESSIPTRRLLCSTNDSSKADVNATDAAIMGADKRGHKRVIPAGGDDEGIDSLALITRNHVCDICSERFYSAKGLTRHKRIHVLPSTVSDAATEALKEKLKEKQRAQDADIIVEGHDEDNGEGADECSEGKQRAQDADIIVEGCDEDNGEGADECSEGDTVEAVLNLSVDGSGRVMVVEQTGNCADDNTKAVVNLSVDGSGVMIVDEVERRTQSDIPAVGSRTEENDVPSQSTSSSTDDTSKVAVNLSGEDSEVMIVDRLEAERSVTVIPTGGSGEDIAKAVVNSSRETSDEAMTDIGRGEGRKIVILAEAKGHDGKVSLVNTRNHVCDFCGESFYTAKGVQTHKGKVHKIPATTADKDVIITRNHVCDLCGLRFYSPRGVLTHKGIVHKLPLAIGGKGHKIVIPAGAEGNDGNHVCDICGRIFYSAKGVQTHKRVHRSEMECSVLPSTVSNAVTEALKKKLKEKQRARDADVIVTGRDEDTGEGDGPMSNRREPENDWLLKKRLRRRSRVNYKIMDSDSSDGEGDGGESWQDVIVGDDDVNRKYDDVIRECADVTLQNDDVTLQNDDVATQNDDVTTQNDDVTTQNDDVTTQNDDITGGDADGKTEDKKIKTPSDNATRNIMPLSEFVVSNDSDSSDNDWEPEAEFDSDDEDDRIRTSDQLLMPARNSIVRNVPSTQQQMPNLTLNQANSSDDSGRILMIIRNVKQQCGSKPSAERTMVWQNKRKKNRNNVDFEDQQSDQSSSAWFSEPKSGSEDDQNNHGTYKKKQKQADQSEDLSSSAWFSEPKSDSEDDESSRGTNKKEQKPADQRIDLSSSAWFSEPKSDSDEDDIAVTRQQESSDLNASTRRSYSLRLYQRKVTCKYCGKEFLHNSAYDAHLCKTHGFVVHEAYVCKKCTFPYTTLSNLLKHRAWCERACLYCTQDDFASAEVCRKHEESCPGKTIDGQDANEDEGCTSTENSLGKRKLKTYDGQGSQNDGCYDNMYRLHKEADGEDQDGMKRRNLQEADQVDLNTSAWFSEPRSDSEDSVSDRKKDDTANDKESNLSAQDNRSTSSETISGDDKKSNSRVIRRDGKGSCITKKSDSNVVYSKQRYMQKDGQLLCITCAESFPNLKNLRIHIKKHLYPGFECPKCGARFPKKTGLVRHKMGCMYGCKYCKGEFNSKELRDKHQETCQNKDSLRHMCATCGEGFQELRQLENHEVKHGEKKYKCDKCEMKFHYESSLRRHQKVHLTDRPFLCQKCGFASRTERNLRRHQVSHVKVGAFKCTHCVKTYKWLHELNLHLNTHTGLKPYKCRYCESRFATSNGRSAHQKMHENKKRHECKVCDKRFNLRHHLVQHMKSHTNERPHKCGICGDGFKIRHHLYQHMDTHNEGERKKHDKSV